MKNGKLSQLQLHHSRQLAHNPLFELSAKTHLGLTNKTGRKALNPFGKNPHPTDPVNRQLFDSFDKNEYWINRANKYLRGQ